MTHRLIAQDLLDIFRYINDVAGTYKPISHESLVHQMKDLQVFQILDKDVQKQKKLKDIRNTTKNKIQGFTKEDISDIIWKYRYIQSSLDNNYFERNTNDYEVSKFREFNIAKPYKRRVYPRLPLSIFTK
jgi:hypothetical protein